MKAKLIILAIAVLAAMVLSGCQFNLGPIHGQVEHVTGWQSNTLLIGDLVIIHDVRCTDPAGCMQFPVPTETPAATVKEH
jgi:hypothetical protein